MSSPISPIGNAALPPVLDVPGEARRPGGFQRAFEDAIYRVESFRQGADKSVQALLAGEGEEVHQTVLAVQRAELAFDLFLQVRNKVVQAYQEIMRMPL